MNIIKSDFKKGKVKLKISDLDDLWYLSHIIEPGDLVQSKTTRKIKIGTGENAKTTKKTYFLKIEAESIDFGAAGKSLRINGKIKDGPIDLPRENYHALSLEEGAEFNLEKPQWFSYHKQRLEEANKKQYKFLICLFDREDAIFALTKKFGYEILVKIKGEVPKKSKKVEIKTDFQEEIIKTMNIYAERLNPEAIILASPAFFKEDLFKKINFSEIKKKIILANSSSVNERALDEVLQSPELAKTLKDSRAREEQILVEELLNEINKKNLASYGWQEVQKSVKVGAVKSLLLTDEFIKAKKIKEDYLELESLMKKVDSMQGKIHILSSKLESGKKLNGLGGIAALLRFKMEYHDS